MTRKHIAPDSKLSLHFTARQWSDLTEQTFVEAEYVSALIVDGTKRRVEWSLDDIEDVQGHIAAAANHTSDRGLERRLDRLFEKLQRFLDQYDDQGKD